MNTEIPNEEVTKVEVVETVPDVSEKPHSKHRIWLIVSLPSILLLALVSFGAYLSLSGVNLAWAVGTSGWVAPPGSKLAGKDIGGKTFDEITPIFDSLENELAAISVWVVESENILIRDNGEYSLSAQNDEIGFSVKPSDIGIEVDIDALRAEIAHLDTITSDISAIRNRIDLWQSPPEIDVVIKVNHEKAAEYLNQVKSKYERKPIDAKLNLASRKVDESKDGITFDVEGTAGNIPLKLADISDVVVKLQLNREKPRVVESDFDDIDLDKPLATYTTKFSKAKRNRSTNIKLVSAHFEGVVVHPGEVFSFNKTTGPRTADEGYLLAPMYVRSRPVMSPAGGSCQVSTTLYNAVLLAGMEIVERYPHSRPCSYVPYGRDATVAYDSKVDFKFKNTLKHPVIIHQYVDKDVAGTITFEIFGHPDDRVHVEIGNSYSWLGNAPPTYIVDRSLAPGKEVVEDEGVPGLTQRAWRIWYDENGKEIKRENLSSDRIRPVGALIRHNPDGATPNKDNNSQSTENPDDNQFVEF